MKVSMFLNCKWVYLRINQLDATVTTIKSCVKGCVLFHFISSLLNLCWRHSMIRYHCKQNTSNDRMIKTSRCAFWKKNNYSINSQERISFSEFCEHFQKGGRIVAKIDAPESSLDQINRWRSRNMMTLRLWLNCSQTWNWFYYEELNGGYFPVNDMSRSEVKLSSRATITNDSVWI